MIRALSFRTMIWLVFFVTGLFFSFSHGQDSISTEIVGVNAWHTPGDEVWNIYSECGLGLVRIGGESFDGGLPYQTADWVNRIFEMGAEPLIQIPQWASAEEAAGIVRDYPDVIYYNIGNEPVHFGGASASDIANYVRSKASAMKEVNPDIKIYVADCAWYNGGVYSSLFGGDNDIAGKDENGNYYVDGLSWHRYPYGVSGTLRYEGTENFRGSIISCKEQVDYANQLHGRTGDDAIGWGIGEYNAINGEGFSVHSYDNGQMFGCILGLCMKYEATYAAAWSMYENGGSREGTDYSCLDGDGLTPRANFRHMQLVGLNFSGEYSDGSCNIDDIFTYGCIDESQDKLCAMLINRSDNSYSFTLRFDNNSITGSDAQVNIDAGVDGEYSDNIGGLTTILLVFTEGGGEKYTYSSSHFDQGSIYDTDQIDSPFSPSEPAAPSITAQPEDAEVQEGENASFSVAAEGFPRNYQWYRDGEAIAEETGASLSLEAVSLSDNGAVFTVRIYNDLGEETSAGATLTVTPFPGPFVKLTETPVVSDGSRETLWDDAASVVCENVVLGEKDSDSDLSAEFSTLWDSDILYVIVGVSDDVLENGEEQRYENDGVELFIDAGNDKSSSYGNDDFHYRFVWNNSEVEEASNDAVEGVEFGQSDTENGYIMEISIPWSTLGVSPGAGDFMGFDVQVIDNDGSGREGKIAWAAADDNAWQDPSVLGTVQLSGDVAPVAYNKTGFSKNQSAYIVKSTGRGLFLDFRVPGKYDVKITSLNGRKVADKKVSGRNAFINTENAAAGIYMLYIDGMAGNSVERLFLR